ncbi:MAG TPA: type IV pilus assembly protein PilM [Phycisphaerae bacterium]|nr:type IV pilus assembly protein PilM [Phycisphaerae bacterium]
MATAKAVWGVDIGQCALKALKLTGLEGEVQVEAFDIIEHPKILSQPDANRAQLVRNALEQFLARNSVSGSSVAISVPGYMSFTTFVKLPPVEPKKIPDIVRFEAEQQIPFPINDVVWRWQTFKDPDSPDVELGLFAMKRADVTGTLRHFTDVEMAVDIVQMAPLALYNFMMFDGQRDPGGATLLADVGAEQTDLVIADGARIWTRSIQIGGNNFTEALVRTFKLSFNKAEKLKRNAATNKYARQIFQAMRPVFADLVQEIQRSVGYYNSLHRDTRFKKLIGLGNGFRLPGLQKYLEQNVNIPVVRIDSYNRLRPSPAVNAPVFTENVLSFAVAYGLALQGLGLGAIATNLLPSEISRQREWGKKKPWFAAAAAVLIAAFAGPLYRSYVDGSMLRDTPQLTQARGSLARLQKLKTEYNVVRTKGDRERAQVFRHLDLYKERSFWPAAQHVIFKAIGKANPNQRQGVENSRKLTKNDPLASKMVLFLVSLGAQYRSDLTRDADSSGPGPGDFGYLGGPEPSAGTGEKARPGFLITLVVRTPLAENDGYQYLVNPLRREILNTAKEVEGVEVLEAPDGKTLKPGEFGVPIVPEKSTDSSSTASYPEKGAAGAKGTDEKVEEEPVYIYYVVTVKMAIVEDSSQDPGQTAMAPGIR